MGRKPTAITVKKNRIKIILSSRNISIQKLAEATGHTRPGLSKAINTGRMDPQTLDDISRYLDVSPDFFTGKEQLRQIKPERLEEYKREIEEPDPSGYYVPSYSVYAVSRMKEVSANAIVKALAPPYAMIRSAYIQIGKAIIHPESSEILSRIDPEYIDKNFNYLVPPAFNFMYQRVLSSIEQDKEYAQFLQDEMSDTHEQVHKDIQSFLEDIPEDQEPDE